VLAYFLMRTIRWATGLLLILFLTYTMMYYGGGDPVVRMFLDQDDAVVDAATLDQVRERYGLNDPLPQQFIHYLGRLAQGDLGYSIREQRPVTEMVQATLPISLQLGLAATLLSTLVGVPLGVYAALRHNRRADMLIVGGVVISNAVPVFVIGPLLLLLLVVVLNLMSVPWGWSGLLSTKAILPVVVLATGPLPIIVRQTRAAVLEVVQEDYIRTARAKGLRESQVVVRHMLRPVLTPVVTSIGLVLITLVNGAIFVELIFGIPGFGGLTLQALQQVDYPVIMATVLIGALIVMVGNFLVDLMYPLLDPRITGRG
jgi:ABC-type dipeptide/oligopeptide/nickel transport system permease component